LVFYLDPKHNRVFLDTNIVWNWHTFGSQIEENASFDEKVVKRLGKEAIRDLRAFGWLYEVSGHYGTFDFVTSPNTIDELCRKANNAIGRGRLEFAEQVLTWWIDQVEINYPDEDFTDSERRANTWLAYGVFDFLPDSADRLLVASAMASHCSIFLTMDYKTILPYHHRIWELTKIFVMRPVEYMRHFIPERE
jgi:predicted nucleic acid-binding protein